MDRLEAVRPRGELEIRQVEMLLEQLHAALDEIEKALNQGHGVSSPSKASAVLPSSRCFYYLNVLRPLKSSGVIA